MTDAASIHDNNPVSRRQILHLVGGQDACPVSKQATNAALEDMGTHMCINCTQRVIQESNV